MREAFVGFDSAWANKAPGALTYATFERGRLRDFDDPKLVHFEEAAQIIEELRDECGHVLVAIDQPTLVPNEGGMRPVERVAASLIGSLGGGVQPANRGKHTMFGDDAPIWKFLGRIGARENPPAAREATQGLFLLEVFPALALPALEPRLMARGQAAHYNPKSKKNFSLPDWKLVASTVRRHADALQLAPLSRWSGEMAELDTPKKSDQDRLDAAICLLIGRFWRQAPRDEVVVIGDSRSGYMVTPVSHPSRGILERAANEKGVPVDGPWRRDVERSHDMLPLVTDEAREFGYPKAGCGLRGLARFTYRNPPGGLNEPVPKKDLEDDSPSRLPTWQRWRMANYRCEPDHRGR